MADISIIARRLKNGKSGKDGRGNKDKPAID